MKLGDVIDGIVDEYGLDRDLVAQIVCESITAAYNKKYPSVNLEVSFNKRTGELEVVARKEVVSSVSSDDSEISLRRARVVAPRSKVGDVVGVPFNSPVGRVEILTAKQLISSKIRDLELVAVYNEFKDKVGMVTSGTVYKRERRGTVVKIGESLAFLPREDAIGSEELRVGQPVKVLIRDVLSFVSKDSYQVMLDRASTEFVKKLVELEIPEVFEGVVEIKKIVRVPGYKSKILVSSSSSDVDPVGTCVGVGGSRVKPILKELGQEKIDFIGWTEVLEDLIQQSLKPAEIDKVELFGARNAIVWLAQDQRAFAIGKMGHNIALASKLVDVDIQLQDVAPSEGEAVFAEDDDGTLQEQRGDDDGEA